MSLFLVAPRRSQDDPNRSSDEKKHKPSTSKHKPSTSGNDVHLCVSVFVHSL